MMPPFFLLFCLYFNPVSAFSQVLGECPSSMWIQFKSSCYILLPLTLKNSYSIDEARDLCKVSGADIISINNEEENIFIRESLTQNWQYADEVLLGIYFDTDDSYRQKCLDQKVLIMTLAITIAIIIVIASTVLWFLYKRHSVSSGLLSAQYQPSTLVTPYSDGIGLVDAEEKEFAA
uniref:CD302 antigen isoform X3 n=1 Tax=Geotrypetes seraphini TaxID=260995 RepID=A0A6P8RDE5_GEOSA|nr:CD302 antigen isoform X3 [Geotrypetes seraphini]